MLVCTQMRTHTIDSPDSGCCIDRHILWTPGSSLPIQCDLVVVGARHAIPDVEVRIVRQTLSRESGGERTSRLNARRAKSQVRYRERTIIGVPGQDQSVFRSDACPSRNNYLSVRLDGHGGCRRRGLREIRGDIAADSEGDVGLAASIVTKNAELRLLQSLHMCARYHHYL